MGFLLASGCWPAFTVAAAAPSLQVQWFFFPAAPIRRSPAATLPRSNNSSTPSEKLPPHPTLRDPIALGFPQLGYRGFRVTPTDIAGVTWLDIFGTAVAVASGGANGVPLSRSFRFDKDAALEQLLFQAVRAEGSSLTDYMTIPPIGVDPPGGGAPSALGDERAICPQRPREKVASASIRKRMAVGLGGAEARVVSQPGRVKLRRAKIGGLQIGELSENIRIRHAGAEHLQNVLHPNAHSANTRFPAALLGIDGDTLVAVHGRTLFARPPVAKLSVDWNG